MTELIDTTEMYLRTIFELEEEDTPPLRARIAERLGHSGPTVSQTVARMERDRLLEVAPDRTIVLTDEGRARAVRVMRKHRLAERLLTDVIGLEWEYVHDEACRWEHVMSERVERKILAMLEGDEESPYGNPIPGLDELRDDAGADAGSQTALVSLLEAAGDRAVRVVVRRIGEPAQVDHDTLSVLTAAGVLPGRQIQVRLDAGVVRIGREADEAADATLPEEVAAHVFVERR